MVVDTACIPTQAAPPLEAQPLVHGFCAGRDDWQRQACVRCKQPKQRQWLLTDEVPADAGSRIWQPTKSSFHFSLRHCESFQSSPRLVGWLSPPSVPPLAVLRAESPADSAVPGSRGILIRSLQCFFYSYRSFSKPTREEKLSLKAETSGRPKGQQQQFYNRGGLGCQPSTGKLENVDNPHPSPVPQEVNYDTLVPRGSGLTVCSGQAQYLLFFLPNVPI